MRAECERRRARGGSWCARRRMRRREMFACNARKRRVSFWCIGRSVTALSVPDMDAADRVGGRVGGGLRTFTIDTVGLSTAVSRPQG